jgi:hypothetical protein
MDGLEIIMLSGINQAQKAKNHKHSPFVQPRPKMMSRRIMMMGQECIWGTVLG